MLGKILLQNRSKYLNYKKKYYKKIPKSERDIITLSKLNKTWNNAYNFIPFYSYWKKQHSLPEYINTFEELYNFPIITNEIIQEHKDLIINSKISDTISTGGSTGMPTLFPGSKKNLFDFYSNVYIGRGWWNINPEDKKLLIWGHSHLFGTGIKGKANQYIRNIKNFINNTKKLDAYNMSDEKVKLYTQEILSFRPQVVIGYTSALVNLAEYIIKNEIQKKINFKIKAVIPTAENITDYDIDLLEKAFLSNVVIEYGMAETGVIAYSFQKTQNLRIFWNSFICSIKQNELILSTLDRDEFPLINYATRDIIETEDSNTINLQSIKRIRGRKKDFYQIENKKSRNNYIMSGIFIVHVIKQYKGILSVQIDANDKNNIKIIVVSKKNIDLQDLKVFFLKQAKYDFPNLNGNNFSFRQISKAISSISGKVNMTI